SRYSEAPRIASSIRMSAGSSARTMPVQHSSRGAPGAGTVRCGHETESCHCIRAHSLIRSRLRLVEQELAADVPDDEHDLWQTRISDGARADPWALHPVHRPRKLRER